jgi:hypothetical protein
MNTLTDRARSAAYADGQIVIEMQSGARLRFPVALNPRLACGTAEQLANMELSPFGIHWPDLDEDLSFLLYGLAPDDAEYMLSTFQGIHEQVPLLGEVGSVADRILRELDGLTAAIWGGPNDA